jgi:hypothetical protein
MIPVRIHVDWLSNHAFTGACAGDYARENGQCHIPSLAKPKQQVPVVEWLE